MEYFIIYMILKLDSIHTALSVTWFLSFTVIFAVLFIRMLIRVEARNIDDFHPFIQSTYAKLIPVAVVSALLSITLPSTKDALIIVGGGMAYNILNSDVVQETPAMMLELINKEIKSRALLSAEE